MTRSHCHRGGRPTIVQDYYQANCSISLVILPVRLELFTRKYILVQWKSNKKRQKERMSFVYFLMLLLVGQKVQYSCPTLSFV
jgi:hypothetical protein